MEIPDYPASRPLALTDKALLDGCFVSMQPCLSEYTFAGLYLFRHAHDYRLTRLGDSLVVLGRGYDGIPYALCPLSGPVTDTVGALVASGMPVYGVDKDQALLCGQRGGLWVQSLRDAADYLYLREELALLPGARFHKKKNLIAYFAARHGYSVDFFQDHHIDGCLELLAYWESQQPVTGGESLRLELAAAAEGVTCAGVLGLEGVVVTVEERIAAFALGERLNADTAVCHFEKADPFMEGLYQLVNREFCKMLFNGCRYVNREQDLGSAGLRSAKLSYHPCELVEKFLVSGARAE